MNWCFLATGVSLRWLRAGACVRRAVLLLLGVPSVCVAEIRAPANVPDEWVTHAERTEFRETPRYAESMEYFRRLADASPMITLGSFGTTPEGRELPVLVAGSGGALTPEAARAKGRIVVLANSCIHAGECCGKDATMMLLRDLAITKQHEHLLEKITLVCAPIFNADGHERFGPFHRINQNGPAAMGWRTTAQNLNLNRDFLKADSPEMRALIGLWNEWTPHLHFDNHTTDGGDWQYDVMFTSDTSPQIHPSLRSWIDRTLYPELMTRLARDGHVPMRYFYPVDSRDPRKGIGSFPFSPRYSTGYGSVRNCPSILVEMHVLKPYRTRVLGTYNIMKRTLELLDERGGELAGAIEQANADATAFGQSYDPNRKVAVEVRGRTKTETISFKGVVYRQSLSDVSGAAQIEFDNTMPIEFDVPWSHGSEATAEVAPPPAYVIPPQWTEAIERVRIHGLRAERLVRDTEIEVESFRFREVEFADRPFEGRFRVRYEADPVTESRLYRAGSVVVRLDQPLSLVAVHMFEPAARDSLVSWGFFTPIFERKEYFSSFVMERMAREMLAKDAALRAEFEERVRTDRAFASDARARLHFFYERTPYLDARWNVYPVGRIVRDQPMETAPMER